MAKDTAFHWNLSVPQLLSTFASDPGVGYFSKNFVRSVVHWILFSLSSHKALTDDGLTKVIAPTNEIITGLNCHLKFLP